MSLDTRPLNCRFRLQDEGKPYPRSGCSACGKRITTGLGKACSVGVAATDTRIAELEAEVERLKAGQKVKPLEWFMPRGAETMRIAETVLGKYRVWTPSKADGRWFWDLSTLRGAAATIDGGSAHSCEAAKAAAQADYEARIMSALVQP